MTVCAGDSSRARHACHTKLESRVRHYISSNVLKLDVCSQDPAMGFFMMMLLFSFGVLANRDKVNSDELEAACEEISLLKMEIAHLEEALNECVEGFLCGWLLDLSTTVFF